MKEQIIKDLMEAVHDVAKIKGEIETLRNENNFLRELLTKQLRKHDVVGRSEQFICLCPRNEKDNCDRKEPCKECETCQHLRQTNCR